MAEPQISIETLTRQLQEWGVSVPPDAQPFMFGNTPELARALADLVVAGTKTATAGLSWAWEADAGGPPAEGQIYVVHDWDGTPRAVIVTTEVKVIPFNGVDEAFARAEGEGDLSLVWWRRAHWDYFAAECERLGVRPAEDMPVVCQRFRVLYVATA
jgi:uncharacterized protein YhfF